MRPKIISLIKIYQYKYEANKKNNNNNKFNNNSSKKINNNV